MSKLFEGEYPELTEERFIAKKSLDIKNKHRMMFLCPIDEKYYVDKESETFDEAIGNQGYKYLDV